MVGMVLAMVEVTVIGIWMALAEDPLPFGPVINDLHLKNGVVLTKPEVTGRPRKEGGEVLVVEDGQVVEVVSGFAGAERDREVGTCGGFGGGTGGSVCRRRREDHGDALIALFQFPVPEAAAKARARLVEIGAPAIPALVRATGSWDNKTWKQAMSVLEAWIAGDMPQ